MLVLNTLPIRPILLILALCGVLATALVFG